MKNTKTKLYIYLSNFKAIKFNSTVKFYGLQQMERQGIFEKLQAIVAKELSVNKKLIDEKTQLFKTEFVDRRYGLKAKPITDFKPEESQYYAYKISMRLGDTFNATNVLMALEEEFDIEIPDEIASQLTTIRQAVDYIYQHFN